MSQRQGLGEILVETERPADRPRDLRHFEAVCQPGPVMVPLVVDKDLRLVRESAEGGRMDDAVAVALKWRTHRVLRLRVKPAPALLRFRCIGRKTNRSDHMQNLRAPAFGVHRREAGRLDKFLSRANTLARLARSRVQ